MSHLEACVDSVYPLCHSVLQFVPSLFLCYISSLLLPLSSLPLSVSPPYPGQNPEETLDLDGASALRLDSSIQAWELLQELRWSMVVVVCVCFKVWGGGRGGSCGSSRKTQLWPLLLLRPSPSRGWRWIGESGDESFPGCSRQEWWHLVSATVKNGQRGRQRLIEVRDERVQIWRVEGKTKLKENVLHTPLIFDWGKLHGLDVI